MTTCTACGHAILDRYVFTIMGQSWHQNCLRCSDCCEIMASTCFTRDGLIYCKNDFYRRFRRKCAGCNGDLRDEDMVRKAKGQFFHINCFQCSVCRKTLGTGDQLYILEGNRFVCQSDFQTSNKISMAMHLPASTGSECNSDIEEEMVDGCDEIGLDDAENEMGKDNSDDSNSAKRRGPRTTIKAKQLETLKNAFAATPKPTRHIREQLAQETGLNMRVIQVWFQNRRSKERRLKQQRFTGYRTSRRARREDNILEMYPNETTFFPSPSNVPYFCDTFTSPSNIDESMTLRPTFQSSADIIQLPPDGFNEPASTPEFIDDLSNTFSCIYSTDSNKTTPISW